MAIKNIVFDYDGTCTQIPVIYADYLKQYLIEFNKRVFPTNSFSQEPWPNPVSAKEWENAQETIRKNSPRAGWTLAATPSAPAAADPYILAYESAKLILRERRNKGEAEPPFEVHRDSNEAYEAPWRPEAREILETLLKKKINVYFISNSSSEKITRRLKALLELTELPEKLKVQSDALKFRICELPVNYKDSKKILPDPVKSKFEALPSLHAITADSRQIHIRRGAYFEAICAVFGNDLTTLGDTVFCGDIWEMDLAMPYELGAHIHLIERAAPFDTYPFEKEGVISSKGKISADLNGLLEWL